MEKKTDNKKEITLTSSQQRAFDLFKDFIESGKKVFILKGYAGTGKTTLLNSFVEELKEREEVFKLLASTGRAAKIMRDRTGIPAATIHSTIYTFADLNQNLDELFKNEKEQPKMDNTGQLLLNFEFNEVTDTTYKRCFYIVDEASMVGDVEEKNPSQALFGSGKLLNDLLRYDAKGKFVFVGDNCQLPPVSEKLSPALSSHYMEDVYHVSCEDAELNQIVRQATTNDIVKAAQKVRNLYKNPPPVKWPKFPLKGYNDIVVCPNQMEMVDRYIKDVKTYGYDYATMICESNRESIQLSNLIRPALGIQSKEVCVGDLLLVTQNNYISGLMNGDLVKVTQVANSIQLAGFTFLYVEVEEMVSKRKASQLLITDILYSNRTNLTQEQQKQLYLNYFFRMKDKGINQKSQRFKDGMLRDPYLNALRATFGYAITCHKSQGGEWNNVYLNIPRRLSCNAREPQYQWLYTAMTRASEKLFIVEEFHLC